MKWFIRIWVLALLVIMGLVACAPAQNTVSLTQESGQSDQNSQVGDTVAINGKPHFLNSFANW